MRETTTHHPRGAASQPTTTHDGYHPAKLPRDHQQQLLDVAHAAVHHGVRHGQPLTIDPATYPPSLQSHFAVFVTLWRQGSLRGCVGALQPRRTLVEDVAANAYAAGFEDPRFGALTAPELAELRAELSVLDAPTPLSFTDEADLLRQLRPGNDGLILTCDGRQGTFLPTVWDHLPEPADFLAQLKVKAGLPAGPLPAEALVQRYTVTKIG